ncbi:MAG TPA: ATPase [Aminobacterium sp.]|jgi:predicted Fe-Mo cluster-binding NifX family protein|uniref:NifB/NifX family molybdenum-iron cluster-binding protein n=1 Tax=Aminobacterium TaxID=81466 RepID=UPI00046797E8|nr:MULTISPECIES: NifB/NifX family molybdenum-iron cluster-binding protein [Aminobacterium]HCA40206.1 ATPase [Aminobacterium sp.]
MKIAIAKNGDNVSEHFGHAKEFLVVDVENQKEIAREIATPPQGEHVPGAMPHWIASLGANLVITGGIGQRASQMLRDGGVNVACVPPLSVEKTLRAFLDNSLEIVGDQCSHDHSSL